MNLRSTLELRKLIIPAVALAATLGIARATDPPPTPPTVAKEEAKAKAKHTPVTALRDRMLENFHGKATNLFTSIPGFGMERMVPMYKYVQFEVPDLSTNEVEIEKEIVAPELLKDAFAKSLKAFDGKPLPAGKKGEFDPFGGPGPGFGSQFGNAVVRGVQLRLLDLVGLMNADGPKVYSGGKAFEIMRMSAEEAKAARAKNPNAGFGVLASPLGKPEELKLSTKLETRPLDVFETTGAAELRDGKDLFIRTRGNVIRMLGALRASEQCIECHTDHKKGDLLGAFSYTFVDTNNTLTKQLTGTTTK